jgi:hypothetical protein
VVHPFINTTNLAEKPSVRLILSREMTVSVQYGYPGPLAGIDTKEGVGAGVGVGDEGGREVS